MLPLPSAQCAKSVPSRADTTRQSMDRVDTNNPLNWAFQDATPCETRWTVGRRFTRQRSVVRYRARPSVFVQASETGPWRTDPPLCPARECLPPPKRRTRLDGITTLQRSAVFEL